MNDPRRLLQAALRHDLYSFIGKSFESHEGAQLMENWHIEAITHQLMRCIRGEVKRLIITLPPRSLKSFIVSTAFPAWLMGHNPREKVITVSYAQDLAAKFARDQRNLMQRDWYQQTFTKTRINPRKAGEDEFETTAGGFRMSTSLGGVLTGRGANWIIIDDPIKAQDALSDTKRKSSHEWLDTTLMSRLDDKQTGVIIVVMQRVHIDDTADYLLRKGGWEILNLPAIAQSDMTFALGNGRFHTYHEGEVLHPEREPFHVLERLKADMGTFAFSAQYLQQPVPAEGNFLKKGWFQYYDTLPTRGHIVQSWDTALTCSNTSDWSVCTTWLQEDKTYYLIDVFRQKLEFPDLKKKIIELKSRFGAESVLIEESVVGLSLIQELKNQRVHVIGVKPEGDKGQRLMSASLAIESGAAKFPKTTPWLADFLAELLAFPAGRHDDQVDSVSQFLNWAKNRCLIEPRIRVL